MAGWFTKKVFPIAIDFGHSGVRLLQLAWQNNRLVLLDAANALAPIDIRNSANEMLQWRIDTIDSMLKNGKFKGRKVISALPGSDLVVQHLLTDKMPSDQLKESLIFQVQDKFPFAVNKKLLRHIVAGEVYEGDILKQEIIVMAAPAAIMNHQMQIFDKLKLEIEAINVESSALVNSFNHSESEDDNQAVMIVDLGYCSSKVIVLHSSQIVFCRTVKLGVANVCQSLMAFASITGQQAEQKYIEAINSKTAFQGAVAVADEVTDAIEPVCDILINELRSCVRYHDLMFTDNAVSKLVFVGGQARDKRFCQNIARNLGLSACIGDPLAEVEIIDNTYDDIDINDVNPQWAVAFGLGYNPAR